MLRETWFRRAYFFFLLALLASLHMRFPQINTVVANGRFLVCCVRARL